MKPISDQMPPPPPPTNRDPVRHDCDRCNDTNWIITTDDRGRTWTARCDHALHHEVNFPSSIQRRDYRQFHPSLYELTTRSLPQWIVILAAPVRALEAGLLLTQTLMETHNIAARYHDARKAPTRSVDTWEGYNTAPIVAFGHVDMRLTPYQRISLTQHIARLEGKTVILMGQPGDSGRGWDELRLQLDTMNPARISP